MTVFASSFAMFAAGRAFEQVRNSVGYPHLNVKIGATHAGLSVGEDGATHQCPLSEMFGYATDLRSKSQGRAQYSMEPSHFAEVPKSIQEGIITSRAKK